MTSHLKTALVEAQSLSSPKEWGPLPDEYSNRASSLTPSSVSFLQKIGVWDHIEEDRVQPYDEMQVWDGSTGSKITFDWLAEAARYNAPLRTVATMTENPNTTRALLLRLEELGMSGRAAGLFDGTSVSAITNGMDDPDGLDLSSWPILSLSDGQSISGTLAARLLVGADGFSSPVRTFAGIGSPGWDYNRVGVVATLASESKGEHERVTAYQRFLPALGGPIAILPLPKGRASLVWSTTPANAAYLKSLTPGAFAAMINAAFRLTMTDLSYMLSLPTPSPSSTAHDDELSWRMRHTVTPEDVPPLVSNVQVNTVASFPLRFRHASTYTSPRIALIGDAAHTIHPLAGQGLNLGLADAEALSRTIEYAVEHGQDLGDLMTLEKYNAERWGANAAVCGACDLLHKAYSVENGPVTWARGLALEAVGSLPWLKSFIMRQAEGKEHASP